MESIIVHPGSLAPEAFSVRLSLAILRSKRLLRREKRAGRTPDTSDGNPMALTTQLVPLPFVIKIQLVN